MHTAGAEALVPEPSGPPAGEVVPDGTAHPSPSQSPSPPQPQPQRAPRLRGVDLARSLAVLGMFAAHVAMAPDFLAGDPSTWGGVVHGRSSILFATLAGVSVALITGRTSPPEGEALVRARLRVLVRAVCLFAVGGLVQLVSSPVAVILEYYAVVLALCVPLLTWRPRRLLTLAAVLAVLVPSLRVLLATSEMGPSGWTSWVGSGGELGTLGVNGTYPAFVWWAFAVAGLAAGRADLSAGRVRRALVAGGVALAVVGYGSSWVATQVYPAIDPMAASSDGSGSSTSEPYLEPRYVEADDTDLTGYACYDYRDGTVYCSAPGTPNGVTPDGLYGDGSDGSGDEPGWGEYLTADQFLGASPHTSTTPEVIGSGGVALAVLGVCLVVADRVRRPSWLLTPLVALGSMPLTAYTVHIVGIAVTTHLSADGPAWLAGGWRLWGLFAVVALVGCTLWTRYLGRGPLERGVGWVVDRASRP